MAETGHSQYRYKPSHEKTLDDQFPNFGDVQRGVRRALAEGDSETLEQLQGLATTRKLQRQSIAPDLSRQYADIADEVTEHFTGSDSSVTTPQEIVTPIEPGPQQIVSRIAGTAIGEHPVIPVDPFNYPETGLPVD